MSKSNKSEYKVGDKSEAGEEIICVIGSCPHFIVFQIKEGGIRWEVDDAKRPTHLGKCLELYDRIDHLLNSGFGKKHARSFAVGNGRALFAAVTNEPHHNLGAFDLVQNRLISELQTQGRIKYVASSTVLTLLVCLLAAAVHEYHLSEELFPFYLGGCMGAVGALLSVYQRCNTIEIPPHTSTAEHSFLGISRILLGLLCGGLLVVLVRANLFMGIAKESLATLSIFAALAGFSERYFPSIIKELETQSSNKNKIGEVEPTGDGASTTQPKEDAL